MTDDRKPDDPDCKCPRIRVGTKVSEARNLSLRCPIHKHEAAGAMRKLGFDPGPEETWDE